jgi:hypothetical protein
MTAPGRLEWSCDDVRDVAAAYVLGALERDEEAAVREHLAACPNPHPEIAELGGVVSALAEAVEIVEPAPALRDRIIAAAAAEPRTAAAERAPISGNASAPRAPVPIERARRRRWLDASPASWALRAAAVLAIAILGGWNLLLQGQVSSLDRFQAAVASVAAVGAQPGSVSAVLAGPAGAAAAPRGVAAARADGTILFAMSGLAPTQGSQVYEAWVVAGGAAPVPVGSLSVGGDGTGVLEARTAPVAAGATLALTKEPGPGATAPTLPILSSGTVRPST